MAKKTNVFRNDISKYELIREILQHIFLYGNYSKGDLIENNLVGSERSFYDAIKRIKNYLDDEYLTTHKLPNRKRDKQGYRFKYDPLQYPINYLADTYRNCSYIVEDFVFYYILLQAFKPYEKYNPYRNSGITGYTSDVSELSINGQYSRDFIISNFHDTIMANYDILQQLGQANPDKHSDSESVFTTNKLEKRLNELVDIGIIIKKDDLYSLAPDILEPFEEDLNNLFLMVQFFYNHSDLCIPGYYLMHTISQYMIMLDTEKSNKLFLKQENPVFSYRHSSIQNVIDDNITWKLINSIHEETPISLDYKNKEKITKSYELYPIKIVIERQYGRHYLFAYNYRFEDYIMLRIDSISNINIIDKDKYPSFLNNNEDRIYQLENIYKNYMQNVWNTASSDNLYEILIHFSTDKKDYQKLLSRVISTGRNGKIIPINDTCFDYRITVKSFIEIKPWIRSFGKLALVDKNTSPKLFEELKDDYRKACEIYGII